MSNGFIDHLVIGVWKFGLINCKKVHLIPRNAK